MRSSFYSTKGGFNNEGLSLKLGNVLELSATEMEQINKIRERIKEQAEGLTSEIDEMQKMVMETTMKPEVPSVPSQKELKDYSSKL